jgi:WD40 repeat protein
MIGTGSGDNLVKIWDLQLESEKEEPVVLHTLTHHKDCVNSVIIFDNDHQIVSGSIDKYVCISNIDGSELHKIKTGRVSDLKLSQQTNFLIVVTASSANSILVYNLTTKESLFKSLFSLLYHL